MFMFSLFFMILSIRLFFYTTKLILRCGLALFVILLFVLMF